MPLLSLPIEVLLIIFSHIQILTARELPSAQSIALIRPFQFFGKNLLFQSIWIVHPSIRDIEWSPSIERVLLNDGVAAEGVKSVNLNLLRSAKPTVQAFMRLLSLFKKLKVLNIREFLATEVVELFKQLSGVTSDSGSVIDSIQGKSSANHQLATLSLDFWIRKVATKPSEPPSTIESSGSTPLFEYLAAFNLQVLEIKNFNFLETSSFSLGNRLRILRLEDIALGSGFIHFINSALQISSFKTLSIKFNSTTGYFKFWRGDFKNLVIDNVIENGLEEFEFVTEIGMEDGEEVRETESGLAGFNSQFTTFLYKMPQLKTLTLSAEVFGTSIDFSHFKNLERFNLVGNLNAEEMERVVGECGKVGVIFSVIEA